MTKKPAESHQATLHLKPGKERSLLRRHPWIYANAIDRVRGNPASGQTVRVVSAEGRFLAHAAYSPASSIRARAWSFAESEVIDAGWMGARVHEAVARREALRARTTAIRLVFGEADRLPGLVADGRDMGTVVFPDAQLKVFLTASAQRRGERRYKQLISKGISATLDTLCADLAARDLRDTTRAVAPLQPAQDAMLLDNSELTIEESINQVLDWWQSKQLFDAS